MLVRFRPLIPLFVTLLFGSVVYAQRSGADCSHLLWNHTYANTFGGFMNAPVYLNVPDNGKVGLIPNAGAGVITFLPGGVVQARETLMVGLTGLQRDVKMIGTYSVKWDSSKTPTFCTGPAKLIAKGPDGATLFESDFWVNVHDAGERVEMIHTNPGLIVGFVGLPAKTDECRNATIVGKYSYTTTGWGMLPGQPADQTLAGYISGTMSGGMQFSPRLVPPSDFADAPEGSARVDGWDSLSVSGIPLSRHMAGWYKLNRDCSGTIVLRDDVGNPEFHIEMFVGRDAGAIYAINVDTFDLGTGTQIPMWVFPIPMQRVVGSGQSAHMGGDEKN